jgi:hypothetical protein
MENEPPGGMPMLVMDWAEAPETNVINPAAAARHMTGVRRTTQMGEKPARIRIALLHS